MPTENKKTAGDLLFLFQLFMTWTFATSQFIRSMQSTAGMSITWTLFCSIFALINFSLAIGAYHQSKSRKAGQVAIVYGNWLIFWLILLAVIVFKGIWLEKDTVLTIMIIVSLAVLLVVRKKHSFGETVSEPITKGLMALLLKSVPQLFIGYCIINAGQKTGLSGITLITGHINVCTRLVEIWLAAKQDGWSKKNIGMLVSELGNEVSWLVTTAIWLAY